MASVVTGSAILVKINGKVYNEAQSISWSNGNALKEVYGIDTPFPQEVFEGQNSISGNISGLVLNFTGGLQAIEAVPLVSATFSAPYISIRVLNRFTGESLLFVPKAMLSDQNYSINARGLMTVSFGFKGLVGYDVLDEV